LDRINTAFILGGSPCSGKSTLAGLFATRCNLFFYSVDAQDRNHIARIDKERHPVMARVHQMSWEEIWMRPVDLLVQDELDYYAERIELINQDLACFDSDQKIIMEGAALLPDLLERLPVDKLRAVFVIPTYSFQRSHYEKRGFIHEILAECKDPGTAFDNWMRRDHLFGEEVKRQANLRGYPVLVVDGSEDIEQVFRKANNLLNVSGHGMQR